MLIKNSSIASSVNLIHIFVCSIHLPTYLPTFVSSRQIKIIGTTAYPQRMLKEGFNKKKRSSLKYSILNASKKDDLYKKEKLKCIIRQNI